jgi:predicted DNA-binding transcriptional regulator AlpA
MRTFSIDRWCELHGFSRSYFYKLCEQGRAPKSFKIGHNTRISEDANNAWIAEMESAPLDEAAFGKLRANAVKARAARTAKATA